MITRSSVLQLEVFIWKLPSVDGLSSSAIVVGEISTLKAWRLVKSGAITALVHHDNEAYHKLYLAHELRDDTVED